MQPQLINIYGVECTLSTILLSINKRSKGLLWVKLVHVCSRVKQSWFMLLIIAPARRISCPAMVKLIFSSGMLTSFLGRNNNTSLSQVCLTAWINDTSRFPHSEYVLCLQTQLNLIVKISSVHQTEEQSGLDIPQVESCLLLHKVLPTLPLLLISLFLGLRVVSCS